MSKKRFFSIFVLLLILAVLVVGMVACTEKEDPDSDKPSYVVPGGDSEDVDQSQISKIKKDAANKLIRSAMAARQEYYSVPDTAEWFIIDFSVDFVYNDYTTYTDGERSSFSLDVRANMHLTDNTKSTMLIELVNSSGVVVMGVYYNDCYLYVKLYLGEDADYKYYMPELNLTALGQSLDALLGDGKLDVVNLLASVIANKSQLGSFIEELTGTKIEILGSSLDGLLDGLAHSVLFDVDSAVLETSADETEQLVGVYLNADTLIQFLTGEKKLPSFVGLSEISWTAFGLPDLDPILEQFLGFSLRTIREKDWPSIKAVISAVTDKKSYATESGEEKEAYVLDDIRIRMDALTDETHQSKEFDLQIDLNDFRIYRSETPVSINFAGKNLSTTSGVYKRGGLLNLSFGAAMEIEAAPDTTFTLDDIVYGLDMGSIGEIPISFGGNTADGRTYYRFDLDVKLALDMFNGDNTQAEINFNYAGDTFLSIYLAEKTVYINTQGLRDARGEVFSLPNIKIENIDLTGMLFDEETGLLGILMSYLNPRFDLKNDAGESMLIIRDSVTGEVLNAPQNDGVDVLGIIAMLCHYNTPEDEEGNPLSYITLPDLADDPDSTPFGLLVTGDDITTIVNMILSSMDSDYELEFYIPYVSISLPLSSGAVENNDNSYLKLQLQLTEDISAKLMVTGASWIMRPDFTYQSAEEIESAAESDYAAYADVLKSNNYLLKMGGEFTFAQGATSNTDIYLDDLIAGVLDKLLISLNVTESAAFTIYYDVVGNVTLNITDDLGNMLDKMSLAGSQLAITLSVKDKTGRKAEFLKLVYEGETDAVYIDLSKMSVLKEVGSVFKILEDNLPSIKIDVGLGEYLSFDNPFKGLFGDGEEEDYIQQAMNGAFNIDASDILDLAADFLNGIDIKDDTLEIVAAAQLLNTLLGVLGVSGSMPGVDATIALKIVGNEGDGFLRINAWLIDGRGDGFIGADLKPLTYITLKSDPDKSESVKLEYANYTDFEEVKKTLGVKLKLEGGITLKGSKDDNNQSFRLDGLLGALLGEEIARLINLEIITADTDLDLNMELLVNLDLSEVAEINGSLVFPNIGRSELSLKVTYKKEDKEYLLLGVFLKPSATDKKGSTLYLYAKGLGIGNLVIDNIGDELYKLLYNSATESDPDTSVNVGVGSWNIGDLFNADAATQLAVKATLTPYSLAIDVAGDALNLLLNELLGSLLGNEGGSDNYINLGDANITFDFADGIDMSASIEIETLKLGLSIGGLRLWFGNKSDFYDVQVPTEDGDGEIDWSNHGTIDELLSSVHVSLSAGLYITDDATSLDTGSATIDLSDILNGYLSDVLGGISFKAYLEFLGYTNFEFNLTLDAYLNFADIISGGDILGGLMASSLRVRAVNADNEELIDVIYSNGTLYIYTTLFGISDKATSADDKKYYKIDDVTDIFKDIELSTQKSLRADGSPLARNASYDALHKYIDVLTGLGGEIGVYLADGKIGLIVTQSALVSIFSNFGIDLGPFFDNYNLTVSGEIGATPLKISLAASLTDKYNLAGEGALNIGLEISDLNVGIATPSSFIPSDSQCKKLESFKKIGFSLSAGLRFNATDRTLEVDDVLKKAFSSPLLEGLKMDADLFGGLGVILGFNGGYDKEYRLELDVVLDIAGLASIKEIEDIKDIDLYIALKITDNGRQILGVQVYGGDGFTVYVDVMGDRYKINNVYGIIDSFISPEGESLDITYNRDGAEYSYKSSPYSTLYGLVNSSSDTDKLLAEIAVRIASDSSLQSAPIVVDITERAITAVLMGLAGIDIEKYLGETLPSVEIKLLGDTIISADLKLKDFLDLGLDLNMPKLDLDPRIPSKPDATGESYTEIAVDSMRARIDLEGHFSFDAEKGIVGDDTVDLTPILSSLMSSLGLGQADFGVLIKLLDGFGTGITFNLSVGVDIPKLVNDDWTAINGYITLKSEDGRELLGLGYAEDTVYLNLSSLGFGKIKMDNFSDVMKSLIPTPSETLSLANAPDDPETIDAITRAYINIRIAQGDGLVISVAEDVFKLLFAALGVTFTEYKEVNGELVATTIDLADVFEKLNVRLGLLHADSAISLEAQIAAYKLYLDVDTPVLSFNRESPSFDKSGYAAISENSSDLYFKFSADMGYEGVEGSSYDFTELLYGFLDLGDLVGLDELALAPVIEILSSFDEGLTLELEAKLHYGNLLRNGKLLPDLIGNDGLNIDVLLKSGLSIRLVGKSGQEVLGLTFTDGTLYVNLEVLGIGKFYIDNAYEYLLELLSPYLSLTGDSPLGYVLPDNASSVEQIGVVTRFINVYASPEKLALVLTTSSIMGVLKTFGLNIEDYVSEDAIDGLVDLEIEGDLLSDNHLLELLIKLRDSLDSAKGLTLRAGIRREQIVRLGKEDVDSYTIAPPSDIESYAEFNNARLYFNLGLEMYFKLSDYTDNEIDNVYKEPLSGILSTVLVDFAPVIGIDISGDQSGVLSATIEGNVAYIDLLNELSTGNITLNSLEAKITLRYNGNGGGDEVFLTILLYRGNLYVDLSALNGPKVVLENVGGIISGEESLFSTLASDVSYTESRLVPSNASAGEEYIRLPIKVDLDGGLFVTIEKTALNAVLYALGYNNYDITTGDDAVKLVIKATNESTPLLFNIDLSLSNEVDGHSQHVANAGASLTGLYLGFDEHDLVGTDFDPMGYTSINDFNTITAATSFEVNLGVANGGQFDLQALIDALIDTQSLLGRAVAPYLQMAELGQGTIKIDLELALNIEDILNGIKVKLHIYMENTAFDITIVFSDLTAYVDASSLGIQKFKVSVDSIMDIIGRFSGEEQQAFIEQNVAVLNAPATDYTSASKKAGSLVQVVFDKDNGLLMTIGEDVIFSIIELIGVDGKILKGIGESLAPVVRLSADSNATISVGAIIESTHENADGSYLQVDIGFSLVTSDTRYSILNDDGELSFIAEADKAEYKSFDELEIYTSFNASVDITLDEGVLDLDKVLNLIVAGMTADLSVADTHRINLALNVRLGLSLKDLLSMDRTAVRSALYGAIDIDLNFYSYDASTGQFVLKEEDAQDLLTVYLNDNGVYLSVELFDSNLNAHISSLNVGELLYDLLGVADDEEVDGSASQVVPDNASTMLLPVTTLLNASGVSSVSNALELMLALGSEELSLELSVSLLSTIMDIVGIGGEDVYNVVKSIVDDGKIAVEYGDDFSIYFEINKAPYVDGGVKYAGYTTRLSLLHDTVIDLSGEEFESFRASLTDDKFQDSVAGFARFDLNEIIEALGSGDEALDLVLDMVGDVGASLDLRISSELRESLIDWTKIFTNNSIDSYLFILIKEALSTSSTVRLKFNVNIGQLLKGNLALDAMLSFMDGTDPNAEELFSLAIRGRGLYGDSSGNDLVIIAYAKDSLVPAFYIDGESTDILVGLDYNDIIDGLLKDLGLVDNGSAAAYSAPLNAGLIGDDDGLVVGGINLSGILDSLAFSKGKLSIVLAKNIIEQVLELLFGFPFEEIDELSLSLDSINNSLALRLSLAAIDRFYLDGNVNNEYLAINKDNKTYSYGTVSGSYVQLSDTTYRLRESAYCYRFNFSEGLTMTSSALGTFSYDAESGRYYLDGDKSKTYIELLGDDRWSMGEEAGAYEKIGSDLRFYRTHDVTLSGSDITYGGQTFSRTESAFSVEIGLGGLDIRLGGYDMFEGGLFNGNSVAPLDTFMPLSSVKLSSELNSSLIIDDQLISYFDASETLSSLLEGLDLVIRSGEKLHVEIDLTLKLFVDFSELDNLGIQLAISSGGKQFINIMYVGDLGSDATIYADLAGLGFPAISLTGINIGEIVKSMVSGLTSDTATGASLLNAASTYTVDVTGVGGGNIGVTGSTDAPFNAQPEAKLDSEYLEFGTALIMLAVSSKEVSLAITGAMIRSLVHGLIMQNAEGDIMRLDVTGDGVADYVMLFNELDGEKYIYVKNGDLIVSSVVTPAEDGSWTMAASDAFRALGIYSMSFDPTDNNVTMTLLTDRSSHSVAATNYWSLSDEEVRNKLDSAAASAEFVMPEFNTIKVGYIDNSDKQTSFDTDGDGKTDYRVVYATVSGTGTVYVHRESNGATLSFRDSLTLGEKELKELGLTSIAFVGGELTLTTRYGSVTKPLGNALELTEAEIKEILALPDKMTGISITLDENESFRITYTFTDSSFEMGNMVESPIDPEHTVTGEPADYITSIDVLKNFYLAVSLEVRIKTRNASGDKSVQVETLEALVESLLGMPSGSFDLALQDASIVQTFDLEAKLDLADPSQTRIALNIGYGDNVILGVYYGIANGSSEPELYADLSGLGLFKASITGIQLASVIGDLLGAFVSDDGINVGELLGGLFGAAAETVEDTETLSSQLVNLTGGASAPSNAATDGDNARIEIVFTNQEIIVMPNMKVLTLLTGIEFPDFLEVRASLNLYSGLNNLSLYINMDKFGNNVQIYLPQNGGLDIAVNTDKNVTLPDTFEDYGAVNGVSLSSTGMSIGIRGLVNSLFDSLYVEDLKLFLEKRNSYWARTSGSFYTTGYNYPAYGPAEEPVNYASAVGGGTLLGTAVGAIWGNDKYADFRAAADDIGSSSGTTAKRTMLKLNRTQENKLEVGVNLGSGDQLYVRIKNNKLAIKLPSFSLDFKISVFKVIQIPFSIDVGAIITTFYPNDIEIVTLVMNQLIAENRDNGLASTVGSVYGTVTDEDGTAITDATVLIGTAEAFDNYDETAPETDKDSGIYSVTTDAYGYYALAGISEGVYEMVVKKSGYKTISYSYVRVTATSYSKAIRQDTVLYSDAGATPYENVEISGSVVDADGVPVDGAEVLVDSSVAGVTDSYGHYSIVLPVIYGKNHVVSADKNGYTVRSTQSFVINDRDNQKTYSVSTIVMTESELTRTVITGSIRDSEGNPLKLSDMELWLTKVMVNEGLYRDTTICPTTDKYPDGTITPTNFFSTGEDYEASIDVNGNFVLYLSNSLVESAIGSDGIARFKFKFRSESYTNANSGIIEVNVGAYNDIGSYVFTRRDEHWSSTLYGNSSFITGMRLRFGADKEDKDASTSEDSELTGSDWLEVETGGDNTSDNKAYIEVWFNSQTVSDLIMQVMGLISESFTSLLTVLPTSRIRPIDLVETAYNDATGSDYEGAKTGERYYPEDRYDGSDVIKQYDIMVGDYKYSTITQWALAHQGYQTKVMAATVSGILGSVIESALATIPSWIRELAGTLISSVLGETLSGIGDKIASILPLTTPHNLYVDFQLTADGNKSVFTSGGNSGYGFVAADEMFEQETVYDVGINFNTSSNTTKLPIVTNINSGYTRTYSANSAYTYGWIEDSGVIHWNSSHSAAGGTWIYDAGSATVKRNDGTDGYSYDVVELGGVKYLVNNSAHIVTGKATVDGDEYTFSKGIFARGSSYSDTVFYKLDGNSIKINTGSEQNNYSSSFNTTVVSAFATVTYKNRECPVFKTFSKILLAYESDLYALEGIVYEDEGEIKLELTGQSTVKTTGVSYNGQTTSRSYSFNDRSTYAKITLDSNSDGGLLKSISLFINGVLYSGEQGETNIAGFGIVGGYIDGNRFVSRGIDGIRKVVVYDLTGAYSADADGNVYYSGSEGYTYNKEYVNEWVRTSTVETYIVIDDTASDGTLVQRYYYLIEESNPKYESFLELHLENTGISLRSSSTDPGKDEDDDYFNLDGNASKTIYNPPYKIVFNDPYDPSDFTFYGGSWANEVGGVRTNTDVTKTVYDYLPERHYSEFTDGGDASESNGVAVFWSYDAVDFNPEGGNYYVRGYMLNSIVEIDAVVMPRMVVAEDSDVLSSLPEIDPFDFNEEEYVASLPTSFFEPDGARTASDGTSYTIVGTYVFNDLSWDFSDTVVNYGGGETTIKLTYGIKGNTNNDGYKSAKATIEVPVKVVNRTITGLSAYVEGSKNGITTVDETDSDGNVISSVISVEFDPYVTSDPRTALRSVEKLRVRTAEGKEIEREVVSVSLLSMWGYSSSDAEKGREYTIEYVIEDDLGNRQSVEVKVVISSKEIVSTTISAITDDARRITPYASATAKGSLYDRDTGLLLPSTITVYHADETTSEYKENVDFIYGIHVKDETRVYYGDEIKDAFTALESKTYVLGVYSIDSRGNRTFVNEFDDDMFRKDLYVSAAILSNVPDLTIAPETRVSLPETYGVLFNGDSEAAEVKVEWSIDVDEILYTFNGGVYSSSVTVKGALFEDQRIDNVRISVKRLLIDSVDLGEYEAINPYSAYTDLAALFSRDGNKLKIMGGTEEIASDVYEIVSYEIVDGTDLDSDEGYVLVKLEIGNKGYSSGKKVWLQEIYQRIDRADVSEAELYSDYRYYDASGKLTSGVYNGVGELKILNVYSEKLPSEIRLTSSGTAYGVSYDYSTINATDNSLPLYMQSSYTIEMIPADFPEARKTVTVNIDRRMSEIPVDAITFIGGSLDKQSDGYYATYKAFGFKASSLPSAATIDFDYAVAGNAGYVPNSSESILNGIAKGTMSVTYRLKDASDIIADMSEDVEIELIAMVGRADFGYVEIPVTIAISGGAELVSTGLESKILDIDPYGNVDRTRATVVTISYPDGGSSVNVSATAEIVYSDETDRLPIEIEDSISRYLGYRGSDGVITGSKVVLKNTVEFFNGSFTVYSVASANVRVVEKIAVGITDDITGTVYNEIDFSAIKTATVEFHNGETQVLDIEWSDLDNVRYLVQGGVYYVGATIFKGMGSALEQTFRVRVVIEEAYIEALYLKDGDKYTEITEITVDPYEGFVNLPSKVYVKFYGIDGYVEAPAEWRTDHTAEIISVSGGAVYDKTDDGAVVFVLRTGSSVQNFPVKTVVIDRSVLSDSDSVGLEFNRDASYQGEWLTLDGDEFTSAAYSADGNEFRVSMSINPYAPVTGYKYSEDIASSAFYYFRSARVRVKDGDGYKYLTFDLSDGDISYNIYDRATGMRTNTDNLYTGRDVVVEMSLTSSNVGNAASDATVKIIIEVRILDMSYSSPANFREEYLVDMYGEYFSDGYADVDGYLPYYSVATGGLSLDGILSGGLEGLVGKTEDKVLVKIVTRDGEIYTDEKASFDTSGANVNFSGDRGYLYVTVGNELGGYQRITLTLNYINRTITSLFNESSAKNFYVGEDAIRALGLMESSIEKITSGGNGYRAFILDPFMSYSENFFPTTSNEVKFADGTVYTDGVRLTWSNDVAIDYYGGFFKVEGVFGHDATAQSVTYNLYIIRRTVVNGTSSDDNGAFSGLFKSDNPIIKPYDYLGSGDVSEALVKDVFKQGEFTVSFTEGCDITYTLGGAATMGVSTDNALLNGYNVSNYLSIDDVGLTMNFRLDSAMGLNSDGEDVRFFITLPGYGMGKSGRQTVAVYVKSMVQKIKTAEPYLGSSYGTFDDYWATAVSSGAMTKYDDAYTINKPYYFIEQGGLKLPDRVRLTLVDENGENAVSYDDVLVTWNNASGNVMRINYNDTSKTLGFNVSLDNQYFGFEVEIMPQILDIGEDKVLFTADDRVYGSQDVILLHTDVSNVVNSMKSNIVIEGLSTTSDGKSYASTGYGYKMTFLDGSKWTFSGINGGGTSRDNVNKWYFGAVRFGDGYGTQYATMTLGGKGGQTIKWALKTAAKSWVNSSIQSVITYTEGSSIDFSSIGGSVGNLPTTFRQYSNLYYKQSGNTAYAPYDIPVTYTAVNSVNVNGTSLTMSSGKTPVVNSSSDGSEVTQNIGVVAWTATTVRGYPSPSKEIGGTIYVCCVPKASDIDSSTVNAYLHNPTRGGFSYDGFTPKLDGYTYPTGLSAASTAQSAESLDDLKIDERFYVDAEYGYLVEVPVIAVKKDTLFDTAKLPLFEAVVSGTCETYMLDYNSAKVYYTDRPGSDWNYSIDVSETGSVTLAKSYGSVVSGGVSGIDTSVSGRRYTIELQAFGKDGSLYTVAIALSIVA